MTYSIFGNWFWEGLTKGWCDKDGNPVDQGSGIYQADINHYGKVLIDNPGGSYDNHSIRTMQENVDKDTYVYLDGSGKDYGDSLTLRYDDGGHDVDIVEVNAGDFVGDFCMSVQSLQTIDKLYMSNVVSFTAMDAHGNPISPVYTASNVYGSGETGDQNGDDFGDGTYTLKETDGDCGAPSVYEITYLDRNGDEKTIHLQAHIDHGDKATIGIDFVDAPICFAGGTEILVKGGVKRVEDLQPGDMVLTKDSGFQPLQWIANRRIGASELARGGNLRPIRIRAGALGENMPERDLLVSPQHRMLVSDWRCEALFGETEMLVPAKALVNDSTVTVEYDADEVVYYHFMFAQHEIVYANGVESESFHPGELGLSTLDMAARDELFRIFPQLDGNVDAFGAPARPVLKNFEAKAMMSA
ncbi:MAG: hypothetical protein CMH12_08765 [Maritimibacter sp.]|nr:hypothetical protein [Maritimibacter sp.]